MSSASALDGFESGGPPPLSLSVGWPNTFRLDLARFALFSRSQVRLQMNVYMWMNVEHTSTNVDETK